VPRLSIAKDFLPDYTGLQKPVQRAVLDAIGKFAEHTHSGLHLEKLNNPKDPRIRTIRITDFWRGVVLAPEAGDTYLLLTVMPHDKAIAYAVSRKFTVNQAIGVLEVRDQGALDSVESALRQAASTTPARLYDGVNDADLVRLGIDRDVLPLVRLLTTEQHLLAMANLLPAPQYDVLYALAAGMTPEQAWQEVSSYLADAEPPVAIDPQDLAAAIERTPDRYVSVSGPDELADILAHPFAAWRTFLHPRQRRVAYRPSHRGPVLVSGGAGTGKTVTALHRAAHLARQSPHGRILLTTFTRSLAAALEEQLALLVEDPAIRGRVEVLNVDRLAHRVVTEAEGRRPVIADLKALMALWQSASESTGDRLSAVFLQREWEQVILAQSLPDRAAYLACERRGRGRPITPAMREKAWAAISWVVGELRRTGRRTHLQVAADAATVLATRAEPPYRHVLIDEGQDLHPAQWRLLRHAVANGPDDLFIVSDPNQRIYDHRVSLAGLGIEVRGRSTRLTVNYRTTQEILVWAVRMLAGRPSDGLDDVPDTLAGYRSPVHGRRPVVRAYPDWQAELDGLIGQISDWLNGGVEPHAIGVAARTSGRASTIRSALRDAGLPDEVRVATMHGMKGMEFRCMAVAGAAAGSIPAPGAVTAAEEDPIANAQDLHRERCLLFVACTRARDSLFVSYSGPPSPFLS
jgi:hypothetical protein